MNFYNLYCFHYNKQKKVGNRLLITLFKKHKKDSRPIGYFYNDAVQWIIDYCDNTLLWIKKDSFLTPYKTFQFKKKYYTGSESEVLINVFKNELFEQLQGFSEKTVRSFIIDLARDKALKDLYHNLTSKSMYYELVYKSEMYEFIEVDKFGNTHYEDTTQFAMMKKSLLKKESEFQNKGTLKANQVRVMKQNQEYDSIENLVNEFTEDEIMLLISVFYDRFIQKRQKLNRSMFIKLVKVMGSFKNNQIFNEEPKNNVNYQKASKGLNYYNGLENKLELINGLVTKLELLQLNEISHLFYLDRRSIEKQIKNK